MVKRRRFATRAELEDLLARTVGSVTHPSSVLDVLDEHGVNLDQLVKIEVDEDVPG